MNQPVISGQKQLSLDSQILPYLSGTGSVITRVIESTNVSINVDKIYFQ